MSALAACKVALLWHGDRDARNAATLEENRLRGVSEALCQVGIAPEPAVYADEFVEEVRDQLLQVDGVLVWVNPIEKTPMFSARSTSAPCIPSPTKPWRRSPGKPVPGCRRPFGPAMRNTPCQLD